jgi:hypothetical protein
MVGQHDRSEALCYYFRLEDQVPETRLLRFSLITLGHQLAVVWDVGRNLCVTFRSL